MPNDSFHTVTGVKLVLLVFSIIGAALGIGYSPRMTPLQALTALLAGAACGVLAPDLIASISGTELSPAIEKLLAFVFGIGGMFIIPGIIAIWTGFKNDPWAWLDKLRGLRDKPPGGAQ